MKIDIHTHTRKAKSGDAASRNISAEEFCQVITSTDVKIIAITNHNIFDKQQYDDIRAKMDKGIQVWPGIELDIIENGRRGHLLVIVAPQKAEEFSKIVNDLTLKTSPDSFGVGIEKTVDSFDHLGPLYIAHYHQKKPDLSDEDVSTIIEKTANKNRVIKEVTNAISAGIFIGHGHPSIYGSDVHDWKQYIEKSKHLPELRLPVESFEHFCLLLNKDPQTIKTILDKKTPENLILKPFEDNTQIELKCFNDINIFFGSKGTGKTKILQAIEKHYTDKGISAKVFTSSTEELKDQYDLKGNRYSILLEDHEINYCGDAINNIKNATEEDVTNLDNYIHYFNTEITNKSAKKILLKDCAPVDESETSRKFKSYYESLKKLDDFAKFIGTDNSLQEVSSDEELNNLTVLIQILREKLRKESLELFVSWKQNLLFNSVIKK